MKKYIFALLSIFMISLDKEQDFEVHEWGVFELYQGIGADFSTGPVCEDLPDFVFRSKIEVKPTACGNNCQCIGGNCPKDCSHSDSTHCPYMCSGKACICFIDRQEQKKPVINFYTKTEKTLSVSVKSTNGKLTIWFPKHTSITQDSKNLSWKSLTISPTKQSLKNPKGSSWWETARDTDAAYVTTQDGTSEKFLFYEGETQQPNCGLEIKQENEKLIFINKTNKKYPESFIVKDKKVYLEDLNKSQELKLTSEVKLSDAIEKLKQRLIKEGLYEKEANGIVKIWKNDFFARDGLRAIYIISRDQIDKDFPLEITPKPKNLVRVVLGCIHDSKFLVTDLIKKLGSEDPITRESATQALIKLGYAIQPYIEEALKKEKDPEVRSRLETILAELNKKTQKGEGQKWIVDGKCANYSTCPGLFTCGNSKYTGTCIRCNNEGALVDTAPKKLCKNCCSELNVCWTCHRKKE